MRKTNMRVPLVLLLLAVSGLVGAQEIGEIVYLEGEPQVTRGGEVLTWEVDFGFPIENFDQVSSGRHGLVEIAMDPSTGMDATVTVQPNTSFYFQIEELADGGRRGTVEMLSGTVAMRVNRLAGNNQVNVRTQSAVMGVRGTDFDVSIAGPGDILVTAKEGRVECTDSSGASLFAEPGQVVEQTVDGRFRTIPVRVSDLEDFRNTWFADRIEVFRGQALRAIRSYAARYEELILRFAEAYNNLLSEREILRKWIREDEQGTMAGTQDLLREKRAIARHLGDIRGVLFIFERIYYRLLELEEYHDEGYGRGQIEPGLSTTAFFRQFEADRGALEERMATVRYVFKLYAKRNDGQMPFDFSNAFDDEFFGTDGDFMNDDGFMNEEEFGNDDPFEGRFPGGR